MRNSVLLLLLLAITPSCAFTSVSRVTISTSKQRTTQLDLYSGAASASLVNNRHSASDWLYNIQSLPNSEVLRDVRSPVLAVAGFSTFVSILHRFVGNHICMPGTAHGFLVSALGLLLVFRTNSAYQRFNVSQY
jgi:hypothetical protein